MQLPICGRNVIYLFNVDTTSFFVDELRNAAILVTVTSCTLPFSFGTAYLIIVLRPLFWLVAGQSLSNASQLYSRIHKLSVNMPPYLSVNSLIEIAPYWYQSADWNKSEGGSVLFILSHSDYGERVNLLSILPLTGRSPVIVMRYYDFLTSAMRHFHFSNFVIQQSKCGTASVWNTKKQITRKSRNFENRGQNPIRRQSPGNAGGRHSIGSCKFGNKRVLTRAPWEISRLKSDQKPLSSWALCPITDSITKVSTHTHGEFRSVFPARNAGLPVCAANIDLG